MRKTRWLPDLALDILVVAATVLVLLEEGATAAGAAWPVRRGLALAAFAADLAFSAEFAWRTARAAADGDLRNWFRGRGAFDALTSLPLLVLVSGPFVIGLLAGAVPASALSVASGAAVGAGRLLRMLRVLRLARVARIAGRDRSAETGLSANRNVTRAALLAFSASIAATLALETASGFGLLPDAHGALAERRSAAARALAAEPTAETARRIAALDGDLLLVRLDDRLLYTRHSGVSWPSLYGPDEIGRLSPVDGLEAFFSLRVENRLRSASALASALAALAAFLAVIIGFGRYFRDGVARPLGAALAIVEGIRSSPFIPPYPDRSDEEPFILLAALRRERDVESPPPGSGTRPSLLARAKAWRAGNAPARPAGRDELLGLLDRGSRGRG